MMQSAVEVYGQRVALFVGACALLLMSLLGAEFASGQTACTGTIVGTITDPSGAAIAASTVETRNVDTGIVRSVQTDESGLYYAPFLQPGHYEVPVVILGLGR